MLHLMVEQVLLQEVFVKGLQTIQQFLELKQLMELELEFLPATYPDSHWVQHTL